MTGSLPLPVVTDLPKLLLLDRHTDHTGRSGTGVVAIGASFPDGLTVVRWRGERSGVWQMEIFASPSDLLAIHGHAGATTLHWLPRPILRA